MTGAPDGFCASARAATGDVWRDVVGHPFNRALADGSLEPERFAYYLVQDARYLERFSVALGAASDQATDRADRDFFAASAERALSVEAALHATTLAHHGVADGGAGVATSAACLAYTGFLAETADQGPFPVLVAALLPCFWIYLDVGRAIGAETAHHPDHPYRSWIDTYADDAFAAGVEEIKGIADRQAAARPAVVGPMLDAFRRASRHEWDFWESAWRADLRAHRPPG